MASILIFCFSPAILFFQNCGGKFQAQEYSGAVVLDLESSSIKCLHDGVSYSEGEIVSGYGSSSAVFPQLCGAKVSRTCLPSGSFDGPNVFTACIQMCVNPESSSPISVSSTFISYSKSSGTTIADCDSSKVISICQASGQLLPAPPTTRFLTCNVAGITCAYASGPGRSNPSGNMTGATVTGYVSNMAVYPSLCGSSVARTCQASGMWTGTTPLYTSCSQKCAHPDTSLPVDVSGTYSYYTRSSGTLSECTAAYATATCQSTGQFSNLAITRYTRCTSSGVQLPPNHKIHDIILKMPSGSWKAIPTTMMRDVCPAPINSGRCGAIINAWGGGVLDEARDRMMIFGGGHQDSYYNNVFSFDLQELRWSRLSEMPSTASSSNPPPEWNDVRFETCGYYPKGPVNVPAEFVVKQYIDPSKCFIEPILSQLDFQQPRSSHTYSHLFIDPTFGRMCSLSGGSYPSGQTSTAVMNCFDPSLSSWVRMKDRPMPLGYLNAQKDAFGNIWTIPRFAGYIHRYDSRLETWEKFGFLNYVGDGVGDIDRKRNQYKVLIQSATGEYLLRNWNLNDSSSLRAVTSFTEITTHGIKPINIGARPGFIYADGLDRFFAWGGGQDIYSYNPETFEWKKILVTGDNPGPQQINGTYGRFRYSPKSKVFILVNSISQDVFVFKP